MSERLVGGRSCGLRVFPVCPWEVGRVGWWRRVSSQDSLVVAAVHGPVEQVEWDGGRGGVGW